MNERYSRQILFPEIGRTGQERLLNSRVLLIGCGALGASHAEMLARAGVGKLRIGEFDKIAVNNTKLSDTGTRQHFSMRSSERSTADQQNAGIQESFLPRSADFGK